MEVMSIEGEVNSHSDFWNQPYYKLTKNLSWLSGQWPYQSKRQLAIHRGMVFFLFTVQMVPQLIAIRHYYNDFYLIMESFGCFLVDMLFMINTATYFYYFSKMKVLLDNVEDNWSIVTENYGRHKLEEHSEFGRQLAVLYAGILYSSGVIFSSEPLQMKLINYVFNTNHTVPDFFMEMEYPSFIDVEKYHYPLIILTIISDLTIISAIVTFDSLFFLFSHHLCGLFAALGYAIENIPVSIDEEFEYVKNCVKLHNRAIKFSKLLQEIIQWNFFLILGVNMIMMSLTAFQVVVQANTFEDLMRNGVFVGSGVLHLFVLCLMSQRIIDYSLNIQMHIEHSNWFRNSVKTQKMMKLMMLKCQIPCQLTAGKMIVMSLETFSVIAKTSASYFTVFLAMR